MDKKKQAAAAAVAVAAAAGIVTGAVCDTPGDMMTAAVRRLLRSARRA